MQNCAVKITIRLDLSVPDGEDPKTYARQLEPQVYDIESDELLDAEITDVNVVFSESEE